MDEPTLSPPPRQIRPADLRLIRKVVDGGFCIGCGLCVVDQPARLEVTMTDDGQWRPAPIGGSPAADAAVDDRLMEICPFGDRGPQEDELAAVLFPSLPRDRWLGRYDRTFVGWIEHEGERLSSSSGGLTTWLLSALLAEGLVDAVVHVAEVGGSDEPRYEMTVSTSVEAVMSRRKTRYYPVHYATVADALRGGHGRVAVVGVPCFIKGVRRLARVDSRVARSVAYTVALICGHMKTTQWHDFLIANIGGDPADTQSFDFRDKRAGARASQYGVRWTSVDGHERSAPVSEVALSSWNYGLFKPRACDFCDDVMGETADITFGDAWMPGYVDDYRGANVVVTRRPELLSLLEKGRADREIALDEVEGHEAAASQESSFRHRRRGLAARLRFARVLRVWTPPKRVAPARMPVDRDSRVAVTRFLIAERSRTAFRGGVHAAESTPRLVAAVSPWIRVQHVVQKRLRRAAKSRVSELTRRVRLSR